MSLNDVVRIEITADSRNPTRAGFGVPLLVGYHELWPERVREYAELAELTDDGFTPGDAIYQMAQAIVSQNPRPPRFKVGRRTRVHTQTVRLTPTDTTEGAEHSVTIGFPDGTTEVLSHTNGAAETVGTIIDALVTAIAALDGAAFLDPTDGVTHLTIAVDTPGELCTYIPSANLLIQDMTTDPAGGGIAGDLGEIEAADDAWYAILLDSNSSAQVVAAAAWVETRRRMLFATTADSAVLDSGSTTDVAYVLADLDRARTAVLWTQKLSPEGFSAWAGKMLPTTPGTETWALKGLSGISPARLSTPQVAALEAKRANRYVDTARLGTTLPGKVAANEWIDVVRGIDALAAAMQEGVFTLLANALKVPFSDPGVDQLRAVMLAVLDRFTETEKQPRLLAANPEPTVTLPRVADVPTADRQNRRLPSANFGARLAGAIHSLDIAGRLTV